MTITEAVDALEHAINRLEVPSASDEDLRLAAKLGAIQEFVSWFIATTQLPDPDYDPDLEGPTNEE